MMARIAEAIKGLFKPFRDARGLTLYETAAVVGMTAIVAAIAIPIVADQIEKSKVGRAANEAITLGNGIIRFFEHTGSWPGEVEIRRGGSVACFLQTGVPATDPTNPNEGTPLPQVGDQGLGVDAIEFLGRPCNTLTPSVMLNINDFLVRKPSERDYPNWAGPYMEPIASDPWDRAYLINVLPLIFATKITDPGAGKAADTGGKLGNGWILTAGPDRLLQTRLTLSQSESGADDIGKNVGTRIVKSGGGGSDRGR